MPLQKLQFRPGLNREGTDYSNEGGWYDGDKIRFRSGFPEKIGGWTQVSPNQFNGVCRSIWIWQDGDSGVGAQYIGLGTSTKYYIYFGGVYNDITPIIRTSTLTNPFSTTNTSTTVTVTDAGYSPQVGDYVVFSGATTVGGLLINGEYIVVSTPTSTTYTITAASPASSTATGGGTVTAQYEYPVGLNVYTIGTGWGAGPWGGILSPITRLLGANPIHTNSGTSVINITHNAHGMTNGTSIVMTGATATGGISAAILNNSYVISNVATNTYDITLPSSYTATSTATGGGSAVTILEQSPVPVLAGSFVVGTQYVISYVGTTNFTLIGATANTLGTIFTATGVGSGTGTASQTTSPAYGWGTSYSSGIGQQLRLWSNDNYGSDLVIAPRGGSIFYWSDQGTVSTRAKYLSTVANTTTELSDTATFSGSASSITVSAAVAPNIYPYMVITGTNLPANTQVASTYTTGLTTVPITTVTTGSNSGSYNFSYAGGYIPTATYQVIASSIQQFVIAYGANPYYPGYASASSNGLQYSNSPFNPMLVRWSDQGNAYQWVPKQTNQSGEFLLTNGSYIVAARTTRQEILVWTDSAIYSQQYLGAPYVWGFQVLMDNISVMAPNSMITINNVTYWMGKDRFYMYSGRVEVLPCALRQYIFADINQDQAYQVFAGANEAYNEVWWYYVSQSSANTVVDKYIIYNYLDRVWYYGNLGRTAWMQTGTVQYPIAADYNGRLLYHENGNDDLSTSATLPISSYVQSSDFDIGDGHNFGFVWRILPDVNFNGSSVNKPSVTMTVKPRQNSGTPYGQADNPQVQSAQNYTTVPQYTIQEFDGQVYTRLRGRQMSFRIESTGVGVAWQLGSPRIDIRPDGRR
jgi:hypothetical protein